MSTTPEAGAAFLIEAMERAARTGSWRIYQHLVLLYLERNRLTEAWYYAHAAVRASNGDVFANVALAQVYEQRRLPLAALYLLDVIRQQRRRVPRSRRAELRQYVLEGYLRTYAYLRNENEAARWARALPFVRSLEVRTLVGFVHAFFTGSVGPSVGQAAIGLASAGRVKNDQLGARVQRVLRGMVIDVLKKRP